MKKILLLVVFACLNVNPLWAQEKPDKIPYTLFDDFETGELFAWEPYPYAEDIGFDGLFFTQKTPTYKNSKYAIARPVKANDIVELYQGFTKRLNIWTVPETTVQVAVYFQSDRDPEMIELSLGTYDGRRYKHRIPTPVANQWIELNIPIADFILDGNPLQAGEHIQVVTLESKYPMVYYLYTYNMLMDNFRINGERQRQFLAQSPESTYFDKFDQAILNRHFFYGEDIKLSVRPEGDVSLDQVHGTLIDGSGKVVKDRIPFELRNGEWVNNSIHRLGNSDARGSWEIQLNGKAKNEPELQWSFKFLMPGNPVKTYPRLFFSEEGLKNRLANENSPVAKKILANALADKDFMEVDIDAIEEGVDRTAENLIGGPYSKTSVGFNAYGEWNNPSRRLGTVIENGSFRYAFTGDKEAGEKAKQALLKLCSFKKWNAAWMVEKKFWTYYPVGYTLLPVSYGYDMLHDLLTEKERKFVRDAIMNKGLKNFHRDMVEMNRMPSNQTNHIAVLVGGHGLAATAIYGEDPENPHMEPFLSGIITKAKTFIDRTYYGDGSYGEPKSGYMNMATREIVLIMEAFERNFGLDWVNTTDVESFYKYPLQATHPSGLMADFGDGGHAFNGFTQHHTEYFVYRTGNPYLYNYVKPYWEEGKGGYLGYLWFRDDIKTLSRESLPTSKAFEAQGIVMRSGWDDASTVISMRIGPHSNHYHFDQGTFQMMKDGEELLTDPGVGAGGYYANLDYNVYNIQAIAHNVMLVDHDAESQLPAHFDNDIASLQDWPRMVYTFTGEIMDAVVGDLSSVYKDKLETYNRSLLFTKSGPLFLFDQVESKFPEGHVYDWLFHAPAKSISYSDRKVLINRPKARLSLDVISPEIESHSIRDNIPDGESFITLTSRPDLNKADFLAVLMPESKSETGEFGPLLTSTRIDAPGWIGARVERPDAVNYGFFQTGEDPAGNIAGFSTDAGMFAATMDLAGLLQEIYFEGTKLSGHGIDIRSDSPISFAAIRDGNAFQKIEVKADKAGKVHISLKERPSQVQMNGSRLRSWSFDKKEGTLILQVPEGKTDYTIE